MDAVYEGPKYRAKDGEIEAWSDGYERYDVDWGNVIEGRGWFYICPDTPQNRQKYGLLP